jgi:TM2 domain-containing membrane protein YozV
MNKSIDAQKQLSDRELIIFNSELDRKRKSTATAYILYLLIGIVGGHKFYLGKPIAGLSYLLLLSSGLLLIMGGFASAFDPAATVEEVNTALTVGILPLGLLSLLMLLDLLTIPRQIRKQEDRTRNKLLTQLVSSHA